MTNAIVYDGLAFLAPAIVTDPFIGFLLSGAVEIPCYLVLGHMMALFGRKIPEFITMLAAGVCLLGAAFVNPLSKFWTCSRIYFNIHSPVDACKSKASYFPVLFFQSGQTWKREMTFC